MGKKEQLSKLEKEYEDLEQYVLDNEADKNCDKELKRMDDIQQKIAEVEHK